MAPSPVKFILFDIHRELVEKWREEFDTLVPEACRANITIVHGSLDKLTTPFDCIVSPANSFGRFDGGFDQILSNNLAPSSDPDALTRTAQSVLYRRWRGFAPPGTCTLIPLSHSPCAENALGCRYVALCPTMRYPASVAWHREIVYNCVWSLLVAVDEHNARVQRQRRRQASQDSSKQDRESAAQEEEEEDAEDVDAHEESDGRAIETVVMTGLATGIGRIPASLCANQMALAFAHFHEATTRPAKWSSLEWRDIEAMPPHPRYEY